MVTHSNAHKLSELQRIQLINAIQEGKATDKELSVLFKCSISNINYYRAIYGARPIDILNAHTVEAARLWATEAMPIASKKGDHRPAMQLLEKTGHIVDSGSAPLQVVVGVALQIPEVTGPIRSHEAAVALTGETDGQSNEEPGSGADG